jgi:Fic family protein
LLSGLQVTMSKTSGAISVLRAAIASFGVVFIHPMADGNGQISRFLVNDVLRRDGAVPAPFILPISATITNSSKERVGYDPALEHFSRPLMQNSPSATHSAPNMTARMARVLIFALTLTTKQYRSGVTPI